MTILDHTREGRGKPTIVFVHGFACARSDWSRQVAHLRGRFETLAVDLGGHGTTAGTEEHARIDTHGRDVAALLTELGIERAVLVAKSHEVQPSDLPESVRDEGAGAQEFTVPPHHTLAEIERMAILQTLERTNWNKQESAHILGLYRPTLYSKMRKHDIEDPGRGARAARPLVPSESEAS